MNTLEKFELIKSDYSLFIDKNHLEELDEENSNKQVALIAKINNRALNFAYLGFNKLNIVFLKKAKGLLFRMAVLSFEEPILNNLEIINDLIENIKK